MPLKTGMIKTVNMQLFCDDCEKVFPTMSDGSVDLVITSPPYNLGNSSGGSFPGKGAPEGHYAVTSPLGRKRGGMGKWSGGSLAGGYRSHDDAMPHQKYVEWQHRVLRQCWRLLSDTGAIFYNHKPRVFNGVLVSPIDYIPQELLIRQIIIWARAGGVNFSPSNYLPTCEWIVMIAKPGFRLKSKGASGIGDVWRIPQERNIGHPATFPVKLPLNILETTTGATVMDCFMGSGTVGVACKQLHRKFIGIEKDPHYFNFAHKRIAAS